MAPPPLTQTDRYIHPEVAKVYWLSTVAAANAIPTRAELNAGTDVTREVADAPGWEVSADRQPVPDLGSKFTSRISGRINPGDSQIAFWADQQTTGDIRALLSRGDQGYITILHGGDVAGQLGDNYPVEVSAISKPLMIGGEPARINVDFSIRRQPAEEFTIPA